MTEAAQRTEVATLAGGCFWCLEAVFLELAGVDRIAPGYAGGLVPNPSYELVCMGVTGHAEVVQVTFIPEVISFRELLEAFFTVHDPTTPNRQGPDVGTQYRSAIFYHGEEQRRTANEVIADFNRRGVWDAPIVTEVLPLDTFYPADDYHRDYYRRNPEQPYCQAIITPKVAKAKKLFLEKLKKA